MIFFVKTLIFKINLLYFLLDVETAGVLTNSGNVIMTMIAVTALMKAKTAKMPIENAMKQLNLLVQTPNVFP